MSEQSPNATVELAPPAMSHGVVGWLRANLFNTWLNSIITIGLIWMLVQIIPSLVSWLFVNATWGAGTAQECRAATGACWSFIVEKHRFILFGFFPFDEHWRPVFSVALFVSLLIASCNRNLWSPWYRLALGWVIGLTVIGHLMYGGPLTLGHLSAPLVCITAIVATMPWARQYRWVWRAVWIAFGLMILVPIATDLLGLLVGLVWDFGAAELYAASDGLRTPLAFVIVPGWMTYVPNTNWGGLPLTLGLSVIGLVVAFPLSILLALGRRSNMPVAQSLSVVFIEFVRGVPLITVLVMASVMFPLFLPTGVTIDKLLRAQIALILFSAAYLAEVIRGGLQAIPTGQYEAADSLGLGYWSKMRLIILPQALKISIPPIVNTFIGFFKDTSLVSVIGLLDLLGTAKGALTDQDWRGFYKESYLFVALIYFVFCFSMSRYSQYLERTLDTSHRR